MAYRIELLDSAERDLAALDPPVARRIIQYLLSRVSVLEDPRTIGEPLVGSRLGNFWRYRVGDYRVIADIDDALILVLVVHIDHRKQVYRRT